MNCMNWAWKSILLLVVVASSNAVAQPTTKAPATTKPPATKPATPTTPPPTPPKPPDDKGDKGTPPPADGTVTEPTADTAGDDVDALRQEYLKLRDELYQSRARAAAVASALYSSKISIRLAYGSARYYTVDRAVIRLDRASVYDDTTGAIGNDDAVRFEGWIAPGRHQISIRIEATGKDDARFTSATEASFVVEAVAGKDLEVIGHAKDGGDIPYQWKKGEHGSYDLSIGADIKTVARADAGTSAKPAAKKTSSIRHHQKGRQRAASR